MLLVPVLDPMALGPLRPSAAELVRGRWLADRPEIPGLVCVLSVGVPLVPRTADLEGRVDPALIPGAGAVLSRLVTEAGLLKYQGLGYLKYDCWLAHLRFLMAEMHCSLDCPGGL